MMLLNFDGSYIRDLSHRGVGGIIQDHNGAILQPFSGLFSISNANEVEALVMLISCKELKAMNGFKAIIKRDYVLVFRWGSTSMSYPWRLDIGQFNAEGIVDGEMDIEVNFRFCTYGFTPHPYGISLASHQNPLLQEVILGEEL